MQDPVAVTISGMPPGRAAEAAVRRRIRALQMAHPAVLAWRMRVDRPPQPAAASAYSVHLEAQVAGATDVQASAQDADLLAALRLAFNALEVELGADRHRARNRAAQWLHALRERIGPPPSC